MQYPGAPAGPLCGLVSHGHPHLCGAHTLLRCREAKDKNREGWYMAYIMDTNEEERVKGITVEGGCRG